jgi:hypothetical protein
VVTEPPRNAPDAATGPATGPDGNLTTDPPRPPGAPDVDELVGDPVADAGRSRAPDDEHVADGPSASADTDADAATTVTIDPSD